MATIPSRGPAKAPPYPVSPTNEARRQFPEPSAPPPPVPSTKRIDTKTAPKDPEYEEDDWEKDDTDDDDDWEIADKPDTVPASLKAGNLQTTALAQEKQGTVPLSLRPGPPTGSSVGKSQESIQAAGVSQISLPLSSTYGSSVSLNRDGGSLQSHNPFLKRQNTGQAIFGAETSAAVWGDVPTSTKYGEGLHPVELPAVHTPNKELSSMSFGSPSPPTALPKPIPFETEKEAVFHDPIRNNSEASSAWEPGMDISNLDAASSRGHGLPGNTEAGPSHTWQEQQAYDQEERERREREAAAASERAQKAEQLRKAEEEWHAGEADRNAAYQTPEERGPNLPPRQQTEFPPPPAQPPRPVAGSSDESRPLPPRPSAPEHYSIKQVRWFDAKCNKIRLSPILTQNVNGPCPLLALANALILSTPEELAGSTGLIETLRTREQVSLGLLLDAVFDELMSGRRGDAAQELPDVSELYNFLMTLHTGMNVNPRFTFVPDRASREIHPAMRPTTALGTFEETKEMTLYSTFDIPLVHGWLPSRSSPAYAAFIRNAKTYEDAQNIQFHEDELEHKLNTDGLTPQEQQLFEDLHTVKDFLHSWPTQLTDYGLQTLQEHLKPGSFAILFRNDHFSTVYKEPKAHQVLTLVTDAGYATHDEIVWESLVDVSGQNSELFSGDFRPVSHSSSTALPGPSVGPRGSSLGAPRPGNSMLDVGDDSQWTTVQRGRGSRSDQQFSQQTGVTGGSSLPPPPGTSDEIPEDVSRSIQEDHDLALALQLQEEEEAQARRDNEARQREQRLSTQVLDGQGRFNPPGGRIPSNRVNIPVTSAQAPPPPPPQQPQQGLRPIIPPRRNREDEEVPPPTYEQAASRPAFVPPTNHPASPSAPLPGSDPWGRGSGSAPSPGYGRAPTGRGRGQGVQPNQGRPPYAPVGTEDREKCVVM